MPAEKKLKTSFAAHEGPPPADKFVIDLTSSKGKKDEAPRYEPVTPAVPNMANTIVDRIAQRKGSAVTQVPNFVPKRPSGAKSGSTLEKFSIMKKDKWTLLLK